MKPQEGLPPENLNNPETDGLIESDSIIEEIEKSDSSDDGKSEDSESEKEGEDDSIDLNMELNIARGMAETGDIEDLEEQIQFILESESTNTNKLYLILMEGYTVAIRKLLFLAKEIGQQKTNIDENVSLDPDDVIEYDQLTQIDKNHPSIKFLLDQAERLDFKREATAKKMTLIIKDDEYEQLLEQATKIGDEPN